MADRPEAGDRTVYAVVGGVFGLGVSFILAPMTDRVGGSVGFLVAVSSVAVIGLTAAGWWFGEKILEWFEMWPPKW